MTKGFNKRMNEITKVYGFRAEPSSKLIKNKISLDRKRFKIRYDKEKIQTMDDVEEFIKNCVIMASGHEENILYI